jgi:hypothetical protein
MSEVGSEYEGLERKMLIRNLLHSERDTYSVRWFLKIFNAQLIQVHNTDNPYSVITGQDSIKTVCRGECYLIPDTLS